MALLDVANYDIDEDATRLATLLQSVLESVASSYLSYGMPLPTRRYYTINAPAFDCEQLVVSYVQTYLGMPGDEASTPQACNSPHTAVIEVSVVRETPTITPKGTAPSPEKIQQAATVALHDAQILMDSLQTLSSWDGGRGPGAIATISTAVAEGGYQEVKMTVSLVVP